MPNLLTTAIPFVSGVTTVAGNGQDDTFTFSGAWAVGDTFTITLTNGSTGVQYQYGAGQATGQQPTYCFTYQNKVYFLSGATTFFSTSGNPVQFNDVTSGIPTDGFVTMSDQYGSEQDLLAISVYQGRLAFFARNYITMYNVNANPSLWVFQQTLQNIGTIASASVQSLGELDVMFLSDTGVRSLRVRDSSLNAFVNDIGSPIDSLLQAAMLSSGATVASQACSVVEPSSGRFWLALNGAINGGVQTQGKIYVLSYFPSSKVIAWSTYDPSVLVPDIIPPFPLVRTFFNPISFRILNGQVYCYCGFGPRNTNTGIVVYGGADNNTYDGETLTVQTPYLDCGAPGNRKSSLQVDALFTGTWTIEGNMNIYNSGAYTTVCNAVTQPTTENNIFGWTDQGSHGSLRATCNDASAAVLSSMVWHFTIEDFI